MDEVVDDYDFRATALGAVDAPPAAAPARRAGRRLPLATVAATSVGSWGR